MKLEHPTTLDNKLVILENEITKELKALISKIKELGLTDIGYKFHTENGDEVIIREVLIEEDGVLSFAVEEYLDDDSGAKYTVISDEIRVNELISLYSQLYTNNISSIKSSM